MLLSYEDSSFVLNRFEEYYSEFDSIQDYQLQCVKEREYLHTGRLFSDTDDVFDAFDMSPMDMNFRIIVVENKYPKYVHMFNSLLELTGSNPFEKSIPGRNLRWLIEETNTKKIVGMIRMGSPTLFSKPRNDFYGFVPKGPELNRNIVMGFNIVPTQPFGYNYLGGKLLSLMCCSHEMKKQYDDKYGTNITFMETTSLYGSSKSCSQYDGLKPYIKYIGLSISDLMPLLQGDTYRELDDYFTTRNDGEKLVGNDESSRKRKIQNKMISILRNSFKGHPDELKRLKTMVDEAKALTERKRTFVSNFGYSNSLEVVKGTTDTLIPSPHHFHKHELEYQINWWQQKAQKRWLKLKEEGRLRTSVESWDQMNSVDMIR